MSRSTEDKMSKSTNDFLIKDFEQAYENLRATDNKRDVIIGFYAMLVAVIGGLVFKNCENLCNLQELAAQQWVSLGLFFLWIVGFVIFGLLIHYRWWHAKWGTLANKIRKKITKKSVNKDFYSPIFLDSKFKPLSLWGAEFSIIILHAAINSIVGALLILGGSSFTDFKVFFDFGVLWLIHLLALLAWYYFQLYFAEKINAVKEFGEYERLVRKLYIYLIPFSLFFCVIISSVISNLFYKIVCFIVLLVIWGFLGKKEYLLATPLKKIEKTIANILKKHMEEQGK